VTKALLYHASTKKLSVLAPPKKLTEAKVIADFDHENYVWFSNNFDYTVFMVIFRYVDKKHPGQLRFYYRGKRALYYPDKFGPLFKDIKLFDRIYKKATPLDIKVAPIWVHGVDLSKYFQKSDWGDYYTHNEVKVKSVTQVKDPLAYLSKKGIDTRIIIG
jgi:hypothetical protein